MTTKGIILFASVSVLNIALLGFNFSLTRIIEDLRGDKELELARLTGDLTRLGAEREALQVERARLEAERTRLDSRVSHLESIASSLSRARETEPFSNKGSAAAPEPDVSEGPQIPPEWYDTLGRDGILDVPDPATMELLSGEERDFIAELAGRTPRADEAMLAGGSAETLLADPDWNARGRVLVAADRDELARLIGHHRYFTKYSHVERYHRYVEPEIATMRDQGAFVEYRKGEAEPIVKEAIARHMELLAGDRYRMYYFFPQDHPSLDHHYRVETERQRLSSLKVYWLINDPQTYALIQDL